MKNLLQMEDLVKGLPDARIQQEMQNPTGLAPVFLLASEGQRRLRMRKEDEAAQQEMPEGTIVDQTAKEMDQILNQGIMGTQPQPPHPSQMPPRSPQQQPQLPQGQGLVPSQQQFPPMQDPNAALMPPQPQPQMPPQGMAGGGVVGLTPQIDPNRIPQAVQAMAEQEYNMYGGGLVKLADGGTPYGSGTFPFSRAGLTYRVNKTGYPTEEVALNEALSGRNPWVGEPYATPGRTNNKATFDQTGNLLSDAAMPTGMYEAAMMQQVRANDPNRFVETESTSVPRDPVFDAMGKQSSTNPSWDAVTGNQSPSAKQIQAANPLASSPKWDDVTGYNPLDQAPMMHPSMAQRAEDLLNPAAVEQRTAAPRKSPHQGTIDALESYNSSNNRSLSEAVFDPVFDMAHSLTGSSPTESTDSVGGGGIGEFIFGDMRRSITDTWEEIHDPGKGLDGPADAETANQLAAAEGDIAQGSKVPSSQQAEPEGIEALLANMRKDMDGISSTEAMPNPYGEDSALDIEDLVKQSDNDSYRNMLMQLGAGIVGNDLSAGIRNAGIAGARGSRDTRELALQGKVAESERKQKFDAYVSQISERDFNRQAKIMGLEIDYARVKAYEQSGVARGIASQLREIGNNIEQLEAAKIMVLDTPKEAEYQSQIDSLNESRISLMSQISFGDLQGT